MHSQYKHNTTGKIATFWDILYYKVDTEHHLVPAWIIQNSKDWTELKRPIFITEDGIDYYSNDKSWSVNDRWEVYASSWAYEPTNARTVKTFSKIENAKQYVIENKPLFSVNELYKLISIGQGSELRNLAKQKLGYE